MRPPRLEGGVLLSPITVRDGDPCHVTVTVAGIPIPDITWFHGSHEIKNCPDFRVDDKGTSCTLYIAAVTEALSSRGVRVVARNRAGVESRDVDLKVYKVHPKWRPPVKSESFSTHSSDTFLRRKHQKMRNVRSGTSMTSLNRDAPTKPSRSMSVGGNWSYGHASHSTDSILDEVFCFDRKSAFAATTPRDNNQETILPQQAATLMSPRYRGQKENLTPKYNDVMTDSGFSENLFRFRSSETDDIHIEVSKAPPLALPEDFEIEPSDAFTSIHSPLAEEKIMTLMPPKEMIFKSQAAAVFQGKKSKDDGVKRDARSRLLANEQIWKSDKRVTKSVSSIQNVGSEPSDKRYMLASQGSWESHEKVKQRSHGVQCKATKAFQSQNIARPLVGPNNEQHIHPDNPSDEPDKASILRTNDIIKKKSATIPKRTCPVSEANLDYFAASIPSATTKAKEEVSVTESIMTKQVPRKTLQGMLPQLPSSLGGSRGQTSTSNGVSKNKAAVSGIKENSNITNAPKVPKLSFNSEKDTSAALLGFSGKNNQNNRVSSESDVNLSIESPSFQPNVQVPSQSNKVDELSSIAVLNKLAKVVEMQTSIDSGKMEPKRKVSPSGQDPTMHWVYPDPDHNKDNSSIAPEVYSVRVRNTMETSDASHLACVKVLDAAISYIYAEAFAHFADATSDVSRPLAERAKQKINTSNVAASQMYERPYLYGSDKMLPQISGIDNDALINLLDNDKQNISNNNRNGLEMDSSDSVLNKAITNGINTNSNNHHDALSKINIDPAEVFDLSDEQDRDSLNDPLESGLCCQKDYLSESDLPYENYPHSNHLNNPSGITSTLEEQEIILEGQERDDDVLSVDTDSLESCLCCQKDEWSSPSLAGSCQQHKIKHYHKPQELFPDPLDLHSYLDSQNVHPSEIVLLQSEEQESPIDGGAESSLIMLDSLTSTQDEINKDNLLDNPVLTEHGVNSTEVAADVYLLLNIDADSSQCEPEVSKPIAVGVLTEPTDAILPNIQQDETDNSFIKNIALEISLETGQTEQEHKNMDISAKDGKHKSAQSKQCVGGFIQELKVKPEVSSDMIVEEKLELEICNNTSYAIDCIDNMQVVTRVVSLDSADQVNSALDTDAIQNETRSEDVDTDSEETVTTVIEVNDDNDGDDDDVPSLVDEEVIEEEGILEEMEVEKGQEKATEEENVISINIKQFAKSLVEEIIIDSMEVIHAKEFQEKQLQRPDGVTFDTTLTLVAEAIPIPPTDIIAIDVHDNAKCKTLAVKVNASDDLSCLQGTGTELPHADPIASGIQELRYHAISDIGQEVLVPEELAPALSDARMVQAETLAAEILTSAIDIVSKEKGFLDTVVDGRRGQPVDHSIQELVIDSDVNPLDDWEDMLRRYSDDDPALSAELTKHSTVCGEIQQCEDCDQQPHEIDSTAQRKVSQKAQQQNSGQVSDETQPEHIYTIQAGDEVKHVTSSDFSYQKKDENHIAQPVTEKISDHKVGQEQGASTVPIEYIRGYIQDIIITAAQIIEDEERMREALDVSHNSHADVEYDYVIEMDDLYEFGQSLLNRSLSAISEQSEPPESDDEVNCVDDTFRILDISSATLATDVKEKDIMSETCTQIHMPGLVSNKADFLQSQDNKTQAEEYDMKPPRILDEITSYNSPRDIVPREEFVPSSAETVTEIVLPINSTVEVSDVSVSDNENSELELSWDNDMDLEYHFTSAEPITSSDSVTSKTKPYSGTNTESEGSIERAADDSIDGAKCITKFNTEQQNVLQGSASQEEENVLDTDDKPNNKPENVVEELVCQSKASISPTNVCFESKYEPEAIIAEIIKGNKIGHQLYPDSVSNVVVEKDNNSLNGDAKVNTQETFPRVLTTKNEATSKQEIVISNTYTDLEDVVKTESSSTQALTDSDSSSTPDVLVIEALFSKQMDNRNQTTADLETNIQMSAALEAVTEKVFFQTDISVHLREQDPTNESEMATEETTRKISTDQSPKMDRFVEKEECSSENNITKMTSELNTVSKSTMHEVVDQTKCSAELAQGNLEATTQLETISINQTVLEEPASDAEVIKKNTQDLSTNDIPDSSIEHKTNISPSNPVDYQHSVQRQSAESCMQNEQRSDKVGSKPKMNISINAQKKVSGNVFSANEMTEAKSSEHGFSVKATAVENPKLLTGAPAEASKDAAVHFSTARVLALLVDNWGAALLLFLAVAVMCIISCWESADA